jgi:hypothetical protein
MKGLALDYIVQWIILLVLAMVVISIIIYFSDDIKKFINKLMGKQEVKARDIKQTEPFSSGQILAYAFSCWDETGEKYGEDATCFHLYGNFSKVDKDWIKKQFLQRYPEGRPKIDLSNFDTSKDYAIVKFRELDYAIVVEN